MKRILWILSGLSVVILLLSINRLSSLTSSYLQPYDFLRWLDFNAMIPIPLASILLYYLLLKEVGPEGSFLKTRAYTLLFLLFISGVYLFGTSSGTHEVTNYLNTRFCERGNLRNQICNIISYNDDEFSHIIYYIGFVLMNVALMVTEFNIPRKKEMQKRDRLIVSANAVFIGLGIFANLAFEEIGLDLYFFGSMMVLALFLLSRKSWRFSHFPVLLYFAISYSLGVIGTIGYKLFS